MNETLIKNGIVIAILLIMIYVLSNYFYFGKEAITASDGEKYYVVGGYDNQQGAAELLSNVNKNVMLFLKYLKVKYRVNYTEGGNVSSTAELYKIKEEFKNIPNGAIKQPLATRAGNIIRSLFKMDGFEGSPPDAYGRHTSHYTKPRYSINNSNSTNAMNVETLISRINGMNGNEFSLKAVNRVLSGYDLENIMENDPKASGDNTYTVDKGAKMLVCLRNRENYALHDLHTVMFVVLHELAHIANEKWGHSSESEFWEIFKFLLNEARACGMHEPVNYELDPVMYCGLNVNYNPYFDESVKKLW